MSAPRQIEANRGNARSSTGPTTPRGKARASRNARRHGLSVSVVSDPWLSRQVEDLARAIVGETASPELHEMARRFAEAQIDLDRIRMARHHGLLRALNGRDIGPHSIIDLFLRERMRQLEIFDRYERRALSRRKSATRAFNKIVVETQNASQKERSSARSVLGRGLRARLKLTTAAAVR